MTQLNLLRTKRFLPIFITQFLGAFNDNFFKNALVILITYQGSTVFGIPANQMVAAAGGIFILPFFLFSAQSGQLADMMDKAVLVRWVKLAEIGIMIVAAFGFIRHEFELLVVALFLMGVHSSVFGPVKYSILPQHLTDNEIVGGNALVEAGTFLAILLGTIIGGILIAINPYGTIYVSVGLIAVAVLGWLSSTKIPAAEPAAPDLKFNWNPLTPTLEILSYSKKSRSVYLSILGISWFWFYGGFLLSLFPSYCKDYLHADSHTITLFLALFSVGIGAGSMLCEKLSRKQLELGLVPMGSIGMSVFAAALYFLEVAPIWQIGVILFALATFGGFYIVPLYTLIQTRSEKSHASRIIAANNVLNALFMVIASGLLILFMNLGWQANQMFLALAVINAVVAIYIYSLLPEFFLRFIVWVVANVMYRLKTTGYENLPKTGPIVLVCNHVTFIDWMIIGAGIHRPVRFIMEYVFARGPFMKWLIRQAKIIPIAPAKVDKVMMEAAFAKVREELSRDQVVCIFPEGVITYDGELSYFRPGIERVIQETPVTVVPLGLVNMWGSFFSRKGGKAMSRPPARFWSRIELRIGEPIPPEKVTKEYLQTKVAELIS